MCGKQSKVLINRAVTPMGNTALHLAHMYKYTEIEKILIQAGADPNILNWMDQPAIPSHEQVRTH